MAQIMMIQEIFDIITGGCFKVIDYNFDVKINKLENDRHVTNFTILIFFKRQNMICDMYFSLTEIR